MQPETRSLNLASAAQQANQSGRGDLALALALEAVKLDQPPLGALTALRDSRFEFRNTRNSKRA